MGCSYTLPWGDRRTIEPLVTDPLKQDSQGRKHVTFLVPVEAPDIVRRAKETQEEFAHLDCIDPLDADLFHVTIKHCAVPKDSDDWIRDARAEAETVFAEVNAFDIELSGVNLFGAAVFAEVEGGERTLDELNQRLMRLPSIPKSRFDHPDYWPHMTLGKTSSPTHFGELVEAVGGLRDVVFGEMTASKVKLVVDCDSEPFDLDSIATYNLR